MTLEASLLLASTIFILGIIPGPGVLLVVSRTISGGLFASLWTIAGIVSADLIFLFIVAFGLQAIAAILDSAFIFIQTIGAAYLIWLGVSIWKNPLKYRQNSTTSTTIILCFMGNWTTHHFKQP